MIADQRIFAFALAALGMIAAPTPAQPPTRSSSSRAFAPGEKGGIHAYEFDTKDGQLKPLHRTAGVENPFFLALSPDRKFLYSIHAKQFGGKENEQVAAYEVVGRTGELKLLNRQSAEGTAACYLDVDQDRQGRARGELLVGERGRRCRSRPTGRSASRRRSSSTRGRA